MLVLPGTAFLTAWMGLMVEPVKKEHFWLEGTHPTEPRQQSPSAFGCRSKTPRALVGEKLWPRQLLWC